MTTIYLLVEVPDSREEQWEPSNIAAFFGKFAAEKEKETLITYHNKMGKMKEEYYELVIQLRKENVFVPPIQKSSIPINMGRPKPPRPIVTREENIAWQKEKQLMRQDYEDLCKADEKYENEISELAIDMLVQKYGEEVKDIKTYDRYQRDYIVEEVEIY